MTILDDIVKRLTKRLRLHSKSGARSRRLTYQSLPLTSEFKFEGLPLRRIMSPPVPATGVLTEQVFDSWLWPLTPQGHGDGDPVKDMIAASSEELYLWIAKGDLVEQTVRLLYALGNAEGASLSYDKDHILVTHGECTYGIVSGTVKSRFCSGFTLEGVKPPVFLEKREEVRTYDKDFCSLYREAYRRGGGAAEALITLHTGQPGFNFRKMAEAAAPALVPTKAQFNLWARILSSSRDPIAKLYKLLVPRWMTVREFGRVVTPLSSRADKPSVKAITFFTNSLYAHFYKDSEDSKASAKASLTKP